MSRPIWYLVSCLLTRLALAPSPAAATSFVRVADGDLADAATAVAVVRVLAVDPSPGAQRPLTDYAVEVEDLIAGHLPGSSIVVRVPGGESRDGWRLHVHGAPRFGIGQAALLFLEPRPDGTWRVLHLMLGAFHLAEVDGRRLVYRDLSETIEWRLPGREALEPEGSRDLERFRAWLEDRARGVERPADYRVAAPAGGLPAPPEKYGLATADGAHLRWPDFDDGGSVRFKAHQSGQPGLPGGGFTELATALAAWTRHPLTPIRYLYGGTTTASGGLTVFDGENVLLFDDPNDTIDDPFVCGEGGILAMGGPWRSMSSRHDHNGIAFWTIGGGDVVTNKNIGCVLPGNRLAEELFAHELGHTLGLGHSADSGALMYPYVHNDGRGARLSVDDSEGITFLYGTPPAAPGDLRAVVQDEGISLTWRDNSGDEASFQIERRTTGSFRLLATVAADRTSYLDRDLSPGTAYTYRVRARNGAGPSEYSNEASATTPGTMAPGDLRAEARSFSQIRLTWLDHADDETEYQIEHRIDGVFSLLATVSADTASYTAGGMTEGTTYTFRVRAVGPAGASAYSNEASATTFLPPFACVAGPTTLCLEGGRFRVEVSWRDFVGATGAARVVPHGSDDSGLFWFFADDNWEMLIKVLDGCAFNRRFWVYAAATTDVEYTLEVTDSWTGLESTHVNSLGVASPAVNDTDAFASCSALPPPDAPLVEHDPDRASLPAVAGAVKQGDCSPDATRLCLNQGRFAVEVEWEDYGGHVGPGRAVPHGSDDSGLLWFFSADNWEMLIKVLDGCGLNDRYWIYAAATTDVKYTLRVTDTETGAVSEYLNALGNAADAITDTDAFATCPP